MYIMLKTIYAVLSENGQIITNQGLANKFNNYFVNVSQNLFKGLGEMNNQHQDYFENSNEHTFFLRETTPDEVAGGSWGTKKFETKKASDLYSISPKFVKISADVIKTKLSLMINESFQQGVFRDNLKVGMVYPIHKGDSEMVCSNYRPISMLPIFSKLVEKLMHKRLSDHLSKYNML